jgi:hypothetical protein
LIDSIAYIKEKTNELLTSINNKELFNDANLIYDYNEVLELFHGSYQPVFINGSTKLKKTELLHQVVKELGDNGFSNNEVVYLDCRVPFLREIDVIKTFLDNQVKFIAINEIQELHNFNEVVEYFYNETSSIKLIATCSVPEKLYELQYDKYHNLKIVVLSEKNESNIKIDQVSFGVFGDLKYNIKNNICEIKGMTKEGKLKKRHIIPEYIDGYPVKIIASGAFHHRTELEKIIIPDSVEYIGDYAFTYCNSLKEIVLPEKLIYIGDCSFLGAKKLENIIGGNSITHIGHSALYGTKWLKKQDGKFAVLGKTIYKYLSKNKDVIIPDEILTLSNFSFANTQVTKVTLTNQKIGEGVFYNCDKLEEVNGYSDTNIPSYLFYNCQSLKFKVNNLSQVGNFSFYNCKNMEKVSFSNSIISNNAFEGCENLKFPLSTIKKIGIASFYTSGVMNLDLRETSFIDEFAFTKSKLKKQNIDRVVQVNSYAFMNIDTLEEITFAKDAVIGKGSLYGSSNVKKASLGGDYPLRYYFLDEPTIEDLTVLSSTCDNFSRNNQKLKKVMLFGERIGDWAFYNNANLKSVQISTNRLGNWAFARCSKLAEIELPKQIEYIDMNCFRYCENLSRITIENNDVVLFGPNALYSTSVNKQIIVHNKENYLKNELWNEYASNLLEVSSIEKSIDLKINNIIDLDDTVTKIVLQNASIISSDTFVGSNRVQDLLIVGDEIVIKNFTFRNWTKLEHVIVEANSLIIEDSAFEGCINVVDYNFPENTEISGCRVFKNNLSLEFFKLPKKTKRIENGLFAYCENLRQLVLHDGLEIISDKAFQYNSNLKYLIIPKAVEVIGEKSFKGCFNLQLLYIPSNIEGVAENAFAECESLTICSEKELEIIDNNINVISNENIYDRYSYCLNQYFTVVNTKINIEIDRPIGTLHPKRENIYYPINYGFVPGLMGGDDEEQDVYVIDSKVKTKSTKVKIIGIVMRLDDIESKWIGVEDDNANYSRSDIESKIDFQEQYYKTIILI